MRDGDIRLELDARLHRKHGNDPNTVIRHEMGLCAGARRIDVAVLNGDISGYEIKSDEDTLFRLVEQADVYRQVLDRVTLVTTPRHQEKSIALLPSWWGITIAQQRRGRVILRPLRKAARNREINPFAVAQLLWRDEALDLLRDRGLAKGLSGKARHFVWHALARRIAIRDLRNLVREQVKARPDWPGGRLHAQSDAMRPTATSV